MLHNVDAKEEDNFDAKMMLMLDEHAFLVVLPPMCFIPFSDTISSPLRGHKFDFMIGQRRIFMPRTHLGPTSLEVISWEHTTPFNTTHEIVPTTKQVQL